MKVIIHGSVFTDNFGDVLFADLFYSRMKEKGIDAFFLEDKKIGISDFSRKEIGYTKKCTVRDILSADALVMISGGYLGEDKVSRKNTITRWIKYILPVRFFQLLGKKVYFIGVGGGPLYSYFLRKSCVNALNKAAYISVRDQETYRYFMMYGVKKHMVLTSDTAQVITKEYCIDSYAGFNQQSQKHLFLHYVDNKDVDEMFVHTIIPALNRFLFKHSEYSVVVGTDVCVDKSKIQNSKTYKALVSDNKEIYCYCGIKQLCAEISQMDVVITPKLHVGIVAATFGKSVISFPIHREKTQRYYKQIGEQNRSIKLSDITEDIAFSQIEKYYNKPIHIPSELIHQARSNLDVIEVFSED